MSHRPHDNHLRLFNEFIPPFTRSPVYPLTRLPAYPLVLLARSHPHPIAFRQAAGSSDAITFTDSPSTRTAISARFAAIGLVRVGELMACRLRRQLNT